MSKASRIFLASTAAILFAHGTHAASLDVAVGAKFFMPTPDMHREEFIVRAMSAFRQVSKGDDTINERDARLQVQVQAAQRLARIVSEFIASDLDGDGFVASEEVDEKRGGRQSATLARWDVDGDGRISQDEWFRGYASRDPNSDRTTAAINAQFSQYFAIDPNGDKSLTMGELKSVANQVFSHFDADGDGHISNPEFVTWQRSAMENQRRKTSHQDTASNEVLQQRSVELNDMLRRAREAKPSTTQELAPRTDFSLPIPKNTQADARRRALGIGDLKCDFPEVKPNEKIAVFSTYEGVKPTSVNLGDETWVIDVAIEPGKDPLYVILPSYDPTVWRFSGAVERVAKVVPTAMSRGKNSGGGMGGSGVVGIDRSKVSFLESSQCLSYFNGPVEEAQMRGRVSEFLGRQPDFKAGSYHTEKVSIPSMTVVEGTSSPPWADNGPALEVIAPETVVAPFPVKQYGLLPGNRGVKQLLEGGYLEKIANENGYENYRIVKTFPEFPTNMTGGMQPTFLLAPGVEKPGGSSGWACVIDEASGKVISGSAMGPSCQ